MSTSVKTSNNTSPGNKAPSNKKKLIKLLTPRSSGTKNIFFSVPVK